jgi:hypothetical protein
MEINNSIVDKYQKDIERLISKGVELINCLKYKSKNAELIEKSRMQFRSQYEQWYSEALEVIRQILPNRLDDFKKHYKYEKRKALNYEHYALSDYMIGMVKLDYKNDPVFDINDAAITKFSIQVLILQSAQERFKSSLFDIKSLLRADLFDSELDSSRELLKNGFLRAAGAVAGVVLEKHLLEVCANRNIKFNKKNPGISNYNDCLKNGEVIDVPNWRFIQRLGDLRNLCDHKKDREPKKEEVLELIDGAGKIVKTLF